MKLKLAAEVSAPANEALVSVEDETGGKHTLHLSGNEIVPLTELLTFAMRTIDKRNHSGVRTYPLRKASAKVPGAGDRLVLDLEFGQRGLLALKVSREDARSLADEIYAALEQPSRPFQ